MGKIKLPEQDPVQILNENLEHIKLFYRFYSKNNSEEEKLEASERVFRFISMPFDNVFSELNDYADAIRKNSGNFSVEELNIANEYIKSTLEKIKAQFNEFENEAAEKYDKKYIQENLEENVNNFNNQYQKAESKQQKINAMLQQKAPTEKTAGIDSEKIQSNLTKAINDLSKAKRSEKQSMIFNILKRSDPLGLKGIKKLMDNKQHDEALQQLSDLKEVVENFEFGSSTYHQQLKEELIGDIDTEISICERRKVNNEAAKELGHETESEKKQSEITEESKAPAEKIRSIDALTKMLDEIENNCKKLSEIQKSTKETVESIHAKLGGSSLEEFINLTNICSYDMINDQNDEDWIQGMTEAKKALEEEKNVTNEISEKITDLDFSQVLEEINDSSDQILNNIKNIGYKDLKAASSEIEKSLKNMREKINYFIYNNPAAFVLDTGLKLDLKAHFESQSEQVNEKIKEIKYQLNNYDKIKAERLNTVLNTLPKMDEIVDNLQKALKSGGSLDGAIPLKDIYSVVRGEPGDKMLERCEEYLVNLEKTFTRFVKENELKENQFRGVLQKIQVAGIKAYSARTGKEPEDSLLNIHSEKQFKNLPSMDEVRENLEAQLESESKLRDALPIDQVVDLIDDDTDAKLLVKCKEYLDNMSDVVAQFEKDHGLSEDEVQLLSEIDKNKTLADTYLEDKKEELETFEYPEFETEEEETEEQIIKADFVVPATTLSGVKSLDDVVQEAKEVMKEVGHSPDLKAIRHHMKTSTDPAELKGSREYMIKLAQKIGELKAPTGQSAKDSKFNLAKKATLKAINASLNSVEKRIEDAEAGLLVKKETNVAEEIPAKVEEKEIDKAEKIVADKKQTAKNSILNFISEYRSNLDDLYNELNEIIIGRYKEKDKDTFYGEVKELFDNYDNNITEKIYSNARMFFEENQDMSKIPLNEALSRMGFSGEDIKSIAENIDKNKEKTDELLRKSSKKVTKGRQLGRRAQTILGTSRDLEAIKRPEPTVKATTEAKLEVLLEAMAMITPDLQFNEPNTKKYKKAELKFEKAQERFLNHSSVKDLITNFKDAKSSLKSAIKDGMVDRINRKLDQFQRTIKAIKENFNKIKKAHVGYSFEMNMVEKSVLKGSEELIKAAESYTVSENKLFDENKLNKGLKDIMKIVEDDALNPHSRPNQEEYIPKLVNQRLVDVSKITEVGLELSEAKGLSEFIVNLAQEKVRLSNVFKEFIEAKENKGTYDFLKDINSTMFDDVLQHQLDEFDKAIQTLNEKSALLSQKRPTALKARKERTQKLKDLRKQVKVEEEVEQKRTVTAPYPKDEEELPKEFLEVFNNIQSQIKELDEKLDLETSADKIKELESMIDNSLQTELDKIKDSGMKGAAERYTNALAKELSKVASKVTTKIAEAEIPKDVETNAPPEFSTNEILNIMADKINTSRDTKALMDKYSRVENNPLISNNRIEKSLRNSLGLRDRNAHLKRMVYMHQILGSSEDKFKDYRKEIETHKKNLNEAIDSLDESRVPEDRKGMVKTLLNSEIEECDRLLKQCKKGEDGIKWDQRARRIAKLAVKGPVIKTARALQKLSHTLSEPPKPPRIRKLLGLKEKIPKGEEEKALEKDKTSEPPEYK